jgi:putative ATP-binding cassette transporter
MVNDLLKLMQIDNKTEFIDNGFTKLDLSTGQRKRLALIVTFMEDKPIYIFDEWAADQDPQFKKYFYDDLLKKLKSEGKTVIAVSHDDRYFHLADRIIKMEYGKII